MNLKTNKRARIAAAVAIPAVALVGAGSAWAAITTTSYIQYKQTYSEKDQNPSYGVEGKVNLQDANKTETTLWGTYKPDGGQTDDSITGKYTFVGDGSSKAKVEYSTGKEAGDYKVSLEQKYKDDGSLDSTTYAAAYNVTDDSEGKGIEVGGSYKDAADPTKADTTTLYAEQHLDKYGSEIGIKNATDANADGSSTSTTSLYGTVAIPLNDDGSVKFVTDYSVPLATSSTAAPTTATNTTTTNTSVEAAATQSAATTDTTAAQTAATTGTTSTDTSSTTGTATTGTATAATTGTATTPAAS